MKMVSKISDRVRSFSRRWTWQDGACLAYILVCAAGTLALGDLTQKVPLAGTAGWLILVACALGAYLSFCWARAAHLWKVFNLKSKRVGRDADNPFSELFVYLAFALLLLSIICLAAAGSAWLWPWEVNLTDALQLVVYFIAFIVAFLPLGFAFKKMAQAAHVKGTKFDHISNESLLLGLLIVVLIVALAGAAGSNLIPRDRAFGVVILGIVLCLFLVFIAIPHIHAFMTRRNERRLPKNEDLVLAGFVPRNPSRLASQLDGFLVHMLAPLTGALQSAKFPLWPHTLLVLMFTPLTAMGFALPAPYGLMPIFFAVLLAVSLGRRWSWVEDDRETAMRLHSLNDKHIRIGFNNDLRDEALLGYLFLFILVPLALRQIQLWVAPFDPVLGLSADQGSLTDWAQFFGIELAKGVPIVDWADIYGIQPDVPFVANTPLSKHLVFGARLMVDLVIIAALLQAWGIVQRNSAQLKLFKDGQLDLLDPFTERAHFQRGVSLDKEGNAVFTPALRDLFKMHAEGSRTLRRGYVPYNLKRLSELSASSDKKMEAMVAELASASNYDFLVGDVKQQIKMLSDRWVNQAASEGHWEDETWLREQRLALEALLSDALDQKIRLTRAESIYLRRIIAKVAHRPEFYNAKLLAFEVFALQKSVHAIKGLMAGLCGRPLLAQSGLDKWFTDAEEWAFEREPLQETREKIIKAIGQIALASKELASNEYGKLSPRGERFVRDILIWAAENESARPSAAARDILGSVNARSNP